MANKDGKNQFYTVRGYQLLGQEQRLVTASMEDYLEMIYRLTEGVGYIRINKLSELLNVKASSATKMVQKLGELNLIAYEKYGVTSLTDKGKLLGSYLLMRHIAIEKFLRTIGIEENAFVETELIEHYISEDTLKHIKYLESFFDDNPQILTKFREHVHNRRL